MHKKDEYRRSLDALRFTPWQKAHLAHVVAEQAHAVPSPRRKIRVRTLIVLSCVIVLLLSVAGASGLLRSTVEAFSPIFGPEHSDFIEKTGQSIGVSATSNGVTITVDAILGDRYSAWIVYSIRRDDGTPLLPSGLSLDRLDCSWGGAMPVSGFHGTAYFMDQDPTDASIQYVEKLTADEPLETGTVHAQFSDLRYRDDTSSRVLVKGSWSMCFDLSYEDSAVYIPGGDTFSHHDMTFTIDEIRISPIALHVSYTVDQELKWSDDDGDIMPESDSRKLYRYFEQIEILLIKTDGTIIDMSTAGGNIRPENGKTYCNKGTLFDEIIPLTDIASIRVGGIEYLLPIGE